MSVATRQTTGAPRGTGRGRAADVAPASNFLRAVIAEDNRSGKYGGRVVTRFPPEPNGYLHYGHAKSICLNFGLAAENGGRCHLRFDDTNPVKEDVEYEDSIAAAVRWLGFDWGEHEYFASDYFDQLYAFAVELIRRGKAFVCDLSSEEIAAYRGNLTEPGRHSPYREDSENVVGNFSHLILPIHRRPESSKLDSEKVVEYLTEISEFPQISDVELILHETMTEVANAKTPMRNNNNNNGNAAAAADGGDY